MECSTHRTDSRYISISDSAQRHRLSLCDVHTHSTWKSSTVHATSRSAKRLPLLISTTDHHYDIRVPVSHGSTARGHLDQHRQGIDSTTADEDPDDPDEINHPPLPRGTVFTKTLSLSQTAHSDLTGRFPVKALSGSEYVFISVLDGYIHCEPIASRHQSNYVNA